MTDEPQTRPIDRERVTADAKAAALRLAMFVVAALVLGWLLTWLGAWGTPIGIVFLTMAAVYLVRDAYAILMGLIGLLSKPFNRGPGTPQPLWLLAWIVLAVVEGVILIALCLYVIEAAGWWTEMQLPPVIDEYGQTEF